MRVVLLDKNNEVVKELEKEPHEAVVDLIEYWDKRGRHSLYIPRNTSEDVSTIFYKQVSRWVKIDESPPVRFHLQHSV